MSISVYVTPRRAQGYDAFMPLLFRSTDRHPAGAAIDGVRTAPDRSGIDGGRCQGRIATGGLNLTPIAITPVLAGY
jgi:hypothetical protein